MNMLPDDPNAVRSLALRQFVEVFTEAMRPLVEAFNRIAVQLTELLLPVWRHLTATLGTLGLDRLMKDSRRQHAHYARHAGRPRSRMRRGRRG